MRTLETGHGYWFRVAGDQPVEWTRAATPARRLLSREPGLRLIAWPGPDETAPSAAAETIVGARAEAICWDPVAQQFLRWTSESDESEPDRVLNRGDALYVRLSHRMAWLEASTAVPRMAFDGGLHGDLPLNFRAGVEADVRYTVRRFATRFEHWLEPERLTVRVVTNDAALRTLQHGAEIGADSWTSGPIEGGFSSIIVRSQVWATDDGRRYGIVAPTVSVHARTTLLRHYFHAVQRSLAGPRYSGIPGWFVQGGPFWMLAEAGLAIRPLERDENDASQFVIADRAEPALDDRALGVTATRWLVERFGRDSYFDFWRNASNAAPQATWRDVFHTTFGITVEAFHDQFEQWIRASHPFAHGRIERPRRDFPAAGSRPDSWSAALGPPQRRADVSPDGSFRVAIRNDDGYRLGVALAGSDCHAVASVDGVLTINRLAQFFSHSDLPASPIEIEVPADFCQRHLRGRITASSADVIADLRISACLNFDLCSSTVTGAHGSFDIAVALPGRYTIAIADRTNSCAVFAHGGATVGIPIIATSYEVIDGDVDGVAVQLADNWCARRIQGRLTNLPQGGTSGIMMGVTANPLMLVACRVSRSPCTAAEPAVRRIVPDPDPCCRLLRALTEAPLCA